MAYHPYRRKGGVPSRVSTIFWPVNRLSGVERPVMKVDDHRGFVAEIADIGAIRTGGIAQDVFQRVGGRPHIEVQKRAAGLHEASTVLIVVFQAVPGDVLAPDDAFAVLRIAGKGQAGHAVTFGPDRFSGPIEG